MNITWKGSPNFDSNRKTIDRIVIHWIVGNLAAADAVFAKVSAGTSAHYGVEDVNVHQYVEEKNVAYHAGNYPMNQRSIGIEHSADQNRPASEATYQTSGQLIARIAKQYNIPLDRQHILRHQEVVATQCPGTMDVDKLIAIAKTFIGGGGTDMANMYPPGSPDALDIANPESMKPAVDLFIKWKKGGFVERADIDKNYVTKDAYNKAVNALDDYKRTHPDNPAPVTDPAAVDKLRRIKEAVANDPAVIVSKILEG